MPQSKTIQKNASYWVSMELEGHNLQNNQIFLAWINQDERHKVAYEEEKKLISTIKTLPKNYLEDLRCEAHKSIQKRAANRKLLKKMTPYIAACALLLVYVGFFMERVTFFQEYPAQAKVQKEILLPDNSIISLDGGTGMIVTFTKAFHSKRVVQLSRGKALFSVEHDPKNPFIIEIQNMQIEVVGTKFEVLNSDETVKVSVLEGKVALSSRLDSTTPIIYVEKAQTLLVNTKEGTNRIDSVDVDKIGLWRVGKYRFNQEPLHRVFEEFAKHLEISVSFETPKKAFLPISGNFDINRFENFLNTLPMIHPLKIERKGKEIILK